MLIARQGGLASISLPASDNHVGSEVGRIALKGLAFLSELATPVTRVATYVPDLSLLIAPRARACGRPPGYSVPPPAASTIRTPPSARAQLRRALPGVWQLACASHAGLDPSSRLRYSVA